MPPRCDIQLIRLQEEKKPNVAASRANSIRMSRRKLCHSALCVSPARFLLQQAATVTESYV